MARSTKEDYTHQQDIEQLNQTLMSLKERYVDNRRANIPSENEAEFWAYRLILAPIYANTQLENELHRLPSDLWYNPRVKTAIEIFRVLKSVIITSSTTIVQAQSNWKKYWDLIKSSRVSYLMACAAEISFNRVRHVVLDSIWRSYRRGNQKHLVTVDDWTPAKLKDVLGLDTEAEAVKHCEAYGFIFNISEAGNTFLDITQMGYANRVLGMPPASAEFKPQIFSAYIVESKRYDRALSSVIQGVSVQQASNKGLLVDAELDEDNAIMGEESLFIPDALNRKTNPFLQQINGNATTSVSSSSSSQPIAAFNQPGQTPHIASNPFLQGAFQQRLLPSAFTSSIAKQPGALQSAQQATNGDISVTSSSTSTSSTSTSTIPLQTASATMPSKTPGNPFLNGAGVSATPQTNPFANFPSSNSHTATTSFTPSGSPAFNFQGSNSGTWAQASPQPAASLTPAGIPPTVDAGTQEAEQKAERERREAAEKQKQEAEARQRVEAARDAQRKARETQEAEQRRKQAEAEQQHRQQQQAREEKDRKAKEEQERLLREAQRRQAQEEEVRAAKIRVRNEALHTLTADVMFNEKEGLMLQFIENTALNVAQEALLEVQKEKMVALGNNMFAKYLLMLKRAGLAKIIASVAKKKKAVHVRERRKRLKAQRVQMAQMQEEDPDRASTIDDTAPTRNTAPTRDEIRSESITQRPATTSNARRTKRTEERRGSHEPTASTRTVPRRNGVARAAAAAGTISTQVNSSNNDMVRVGYSKAYQQSTAPIDRTETDWFKLRAMGIDPSKHRKRSFDSTSEEEDQVKTESKRAKLSPPVPDRVNSETPLPPPTTAEDQLARFRAIQQAFRKSAPSPTGLSNSVATISRRASVIDSTSSIIARAREVVADASVPPLASPPAHTVLGLASQHIQHDWGRSVPNLGLSSAVSRQSPVGRSINAVEPQERPAYCQRASRFVPRHLYGQGPEATRAYHDKYVTKSPTKSATSVSANPMVPSSPIPTQLSYVPQPQGYSQTFAVQQHHENDGSRGLEVVNDNTEYGNENVFITDDEEHHHIDDGNAHLDSHLDRLYGNQGEDAQDADSEMIDSDEDDEEDDDEEEEEDEEEGRYKTIHRRLPLQNCSEESLEDYDEYTEDEDDASPQPAQRHTSQSGPHSQRSLSAQGGNTQDDAIELSD